jgi:AcrR family transcriptional regulator
MAPGSSPAVDSMKAAEHTVRRQAKRARLLAAMADSIARRGFRASTVGEVVRLARTSRRTFYEHFADREDCLLALFERTAEEMLSQIRDAVDPGARWQDQVDRAIDAYIAHVVAHPELHRSFARELPATGQAGAQLQRRVMERFAATLMALVQRAREAQGECSVPPLSRELAIVLVAGLRELLVISLQDGAQPQALRAGARQVTLALLGAPPPPASADRHEDGAGGR